MFPCIIPAQPGFYVVTRVVGHTGHIPVIAWCMLDEHSVRAVTLDGVEPEDTLIVGPDGKQAHR